MGSAAQVRGLPPAGGPAGHCLGRRRSRSLRPRSGLTGGGTGRRWRHLRSPRPLAGPRGAERPPAAALRVQPPAQSRSRRSNGAPPLFRTAPPRTGASSPATPGSRRAGRQDRVSTQDTIYSFPLARRGKKNTRNAAPQSVTLVSFPSQPPQHRYNAAHLNPLNFI